MMKIKISFLLSIIWSLTIQAQGFNYEADLSPIVSSGYYKIELTSEVLGKTSSNLSDLRIYDLAGIEQPYLIDQESSSATNGAFKEYEIIERVERTSDSSSFLTFVNSSGKPIDNLSFVVQNTAVRKTAILSGSNDRKNWYVIRNNYSLQSMHKSNGTTFTKRLDFPLSDYSFFKLAVKDNVKAPINMLKIGYQQNGKRISGLKSSFDFLIESQKESENVSFIKLTLPETKYFEILKFQLSGAEFYSRSARIYIKQIIENRKQEKELVKRQIGSITLNSNSGNSLNIGALKLQEIFVEIDNQDNRPLTLEKVSGSFLSKYVVADLKAGESYKLKFGNADRAAPNYDLAYFKNQIPDDTKKVKLQGIRSLMSEKSSATPELSLFENVYLIWSIIGIVGILLGFMSIKMIRELGSKTESNK